MASNEAKVVNSNSSGATLVGSKRKRQGRRKIPIEPIQNEDARQVCFSKRRRDLFKKASELSVLCGANVAVIAISPAGRPYSFIHPSNTPSVLDRYISSPQVPGHALQTDSLTRQVSELSAAIAAAKAKKETLKTKIDGLHESIWSAYVPGHSLQTDSLTRQVSELSAAIAAVKAKKETLKTKIDGLHESIWSAYVNKLSLEELMVVRTRLLQVKGDLKANAEMTTHDSSGVSVPNMGTSSNEIDH